MLIDGKFRCAGCMKELNEEFELCSCGYNNETESNPPHCLQIGMILNNTYVIGKVIGEGGFGITYVGWDRDLDKKVAIKEFFLNGSTTRNSTISSEVYSSIGDDADIFEINREKFVNEAKLLASFMEEPGIVTVYRFFRENNTAYIVMEFVEGYTLKTYLSQKGKLSVDETMGILGPVMNSLSKIHERNLIHRDISPDNIMITATGRGKLIDFGAAREANGGNKSLSVVLKHGFAPVEQYQSRGNQGPWTDVYALSATIYRCITGKVPPEAVDRVLDDIHVSVCEIDPTVSKAVSDVIDKGLAIKVENRYQTVGDLKKDLIAALNGKPLSIDKTTTAIGVNTNSNAMVNSMESVKNVTDIAGNSNNLPNGNMAVNRNISTNSNVTSNYNAISNNAVQGGEAYNKNDENSKKKTINKTAIISILVAMVAVIACISIGLTISNKANTKNSRKTAKGEDIEYETEEIESVEKKKDEPKVEEPQVVESEEKAEEVQEIVVAEDTGDVLNIYIWNEEFKARIEDHYPGYIGTDATHGRIGNVEVVWNVTPTDDGAYQKNLDSALLSQDSAAPNDRVDLFCIEADYALKYIDTDYTLPIAACGITDADVADQYQYTKDVVTDYKGQLKGAAWQGCPGVLIYNREAARRVLGSDSPADVQRAVSDWSTFKQTATLMKQAGYKMTATANDSFRVFQNNVTTNWVDSNNRINIDTNIKAWVDMTKKMVDAGETTTADLWSDRWMDGFYYSGNVFCYFGPAWFVDYCMGWDGGSIADNGGWGACKGPQGFFWGGTWLCVPTGTDNPQLVGDIIRQMTCNPDVMQEIVWEDNDFVNNKSVMNSMARDVRYGDSVLGGQNALEFYVENAEAIRLRNLTAYDQGINEFFLYAMSDYFDGRVSYDSALNSFYSNVVKIYPELTY